MKKMKQWYVVYVNVKHEKKVFEKFIELRMEAYLPLVKKIKQWSDRKKMVEEPLFTGYVFVKLQAYELDKPLFVKGVLNYLSFNQKKAVVRDSEIESLKFLVENGYNLNTETTNVQAGDKVKLLLSAFKNEQAVVKAISNDEALIYFEGLNQYIAVKAPVNALEIIK